ncbi:MAG: hypothetical protein II715_04555, partial [Clostridia bacterium]|nr:hypothetical protein [Clostridia bacterium]
SSRDASGAETEVFTSGSSGAYFIDRLPFGTYYVHETVTPSGFKTLDDGTNWFTLTVDAGGVKITERMNAEP